ncbi:hypothetical protein N476_22045 [Pseudoalteromonas luteoviolacea H33]|uniref:Uncharacterized protein n=1 Tax=Pseudoalteromonas luteoviolacea H33 TaxID=1365251 RepID=A0A167D1A4_9GAMM|nr:hypothetical protein N476_22045 [Pseudoalteromonas luteoviolacea H33]KZN70051.1 hypothetical protein N477_26000 [Pseudoalteromonas luteoviolacea H33-S]
MNIYQKSKKHQEQSAEVYIVISCHISGTSGSCVKQIWGLL